MQHGSLFQGKFTLGRMKSEGKTKPHNTFESIARKERLVLDP
jgi:hypothetical protein